MKTMLKEEKYKKELNNDSGTKLITKDNMSNYK